MAAALVEVADGRVPKDRIALRELYAEMIQWPFVGSNDDPSPSTSSPGPSPYEAITKTGAEGVPHFWRTRTLHARMSFMPHQRSSGADM